MRQFDTTIPFGTFSCPDDSQDGVRQYLHLNSSFDRPTNAPSRTSGLQGELSNAVGTQQGLVTTDRFLNNDFVLAHGHGQYADLKNGSYQTTISNAQDSFGTSSVNNHGVQIHALKPEYLLGTDGVGDFQDSEVCNILNHRHFANISTLAGANDIGQYRGSGNSDGSNYGESPDFVYPLASGLGHMSVGYLPASYNALNINDPMIFAPGALVSTPNTTSTDFSPSGASDNSSGVGTCINYSLRGITPVAQPRVSNTPAINICPKCGTTVGRKADMKRHMRKHDGAVAQVYKCPMAACLTSPGFYRKDKLNDHLQDAHGLMSVERNAKGKRIGP